MGKVVAIVQARSSSKRLPRKVLLELGGMPLIVYLLRRIVRAKELDAVILATSCDASDDELVRVVEEEGIPVYRGALNDVLKRYIECAEANDAEIVVRVTGDCPLVDSQIIDEMVRSFKADSAGYMSNCLNEDEIAVPDGFDVEVFGIQHLRDADRYAKKQSEREHVTPWIRSKEAGIECRHFKYLDKSFDYRLTVDEAVDYEVVKAIVEHFGGKIDFTLKDVLSHLSENVSLAMKNSFISRNEGYRESLRRECKEVQVLNAQKLWKKAKDLIPGGNMLLSKRPEMFLPGKWPTYFSRAKGCYVWGLDGRKYLDMSIMGIGTNILGYGNSEVDNAVREVVDKGNMSSLNCPEEVMLAEALVELHPWADMARFARSGGEANAIAVRIARAATGRERVAICGYHGWHDWYLATNLGGDAALEEHLLPGLAPKGVPRGLRGTVMPFSYNRLDQLQRIVDGGPIAAVKMEVQRSTPPEPGFLESVRKICNDVGAVLIFDECTSGFRETNGGLHKKYKINPDMAVFGKALGNGYPITAVVGKRQIMKNAKKSFISSTFWSERIGFVAGFYTLKYMNDCKSWIVISKIGKMIKKEWVRIFFKYGFEVNINGLDSIPSFSFKNNNSERVTYLTQEMLKRNFLSGSTIFISISHKKTLTSKYLKNFEECVKKLKQIENKGIKIKTKLLGPIKAETFERLN